MQVGVTAMATPLQHTVVQLRKAKAQQQKSLEDEGKEPEPRLFNLYLNEQHTFLNKVSKKDMSIEGQTGFLDTVKGLVGKFIICTKEEDPENVVPDGFISIDWIDQERKEVNALLEVLHNQYKSQPAAK
jgi:hypothetical protein